MAFRLTHGSGHAVASHSARSKIPVWSIRYGITIATANERLKAVALAEREAGLLQAAQGTPALEIDRVAVDLEERPVEWRLSTCLTQDIHYLSVLR